MVWLGLRLAHPTTLITHFRLLQPTQTTLPPPFRRGPQSFSDFYHWYLSDTFVGLRIGLDAPDVWAAQRPCSQWYHWQWYISLAIWRGVIAACLDESGSIQKIGWILNIRVYVCCRAHVPFRPYQGEMPNISPFLQHNILLQRWHTYPLRRVSVVLFGILWVHPPFLLWADEWLSKRFLWITNVPAELRRMLFLLIFYMPSRDDNRSMI